jgi:hypothetical protein
MRSPSIIDSRPAAEARAERIQLAVERLAERRVAGPRRAATEQRSGVAARMRSFAGARAEVINLAMHHGYLAEQIEFDDQGLFLRAWDSRGVPLKEAQVARRCFSRLRRAAFERPTGAAARVVREHQSRVRRLRARSPAKRARRAVQRARRGRRVSRPVRGRARAPDPDPAPSAQSVRVGSTSGVPS